MVVNLLAAADLIFVLRFERSVQDDPSDDE